MEAMEVASISWRPSAAITTTTGVLATVVLLFCVSCSGGASVRAGSAVAAPGNASVDAALGTPEILSPGSDSSVSSPDLVVRLGFPSETASGQLLSSQAALWPAGSSSDKPPAAEGSAQGTSVSISLSGLDNGGTYELRARIVSRNQASGETTYSRWSNPVKLVLAVQLQGIVLDDPPSGGVEVDTSPTIRWKYDGRAVKYRVELYGGPAGGKVPAAGASLIASAGDITTPEYTVTQALAPGTYSYRVQAEDSSGLWTDWTPLAEFSLNPDEPLTPTVLNDGESSIDPRFVVGWKQVYGASSFEIQISASGTFSGNLIVNRTVGNRTDGIRTDGNRTVFRAENPFPVGNSYFYRVRALTDDGVQLPWSPTTRFTVGDIGLRFAPVISPGKEATFAMGATDSGYDAVPVHTVKLTVPFEMEIYPVTNAQFATVANWMIAHKMAAVRDAELVSTEPATGNGGPIVIAGFGKLNYGEQFGLEVRQNRVEAIRGRENQPVVGVSWNGAILFANAVSILTGEPPAYVPGSETWVQHTGSARLPTEAEWEYAMRGTDGRVFPWGNTLTPAAANYSGSGNPYESSYPPYTRNGGPLTPVGFYDGATHAGFRTLSNASPFGIFGLVGNVWEWCWDRYSPGTYTSEAGGAQNPTGPATGRERVTRGGAWNVGAPYVRGTRRGHYPVDGLSYSTGLRLVRTLGGAP